MESVTIVEKSDMTRDGLIFNGGSDLPEESNNSSFSRTRTKVPKWQIGILIALKAAGTFAIFLLGDIMAKSLDPSLPLTANTHYFIPSGMLWRFSQFLQLVTFIQFSSGCIFILVQKPFTLNSPSTAPVGSIFSRSEWMRIMRHSFYSTLLLIIRVAGLQLCGPFRTVFISTHYDFTLAGIITAIMIFKSGPRLRGTVLVGIGLALVLLFDEPSTVASVPRRKEDSGSGYFSTNSLGVFILVISVLLRFGFNGFSRSLASDVGGQMRLHAVSTFVSGCFLALLFVIDLMSSSDMISVSILPVAFIVLFGFVLDFYVDAYFTKKMEGSQLSRIGTTASHLSALVFAMLWKSTEVPSITTLLAFGLIYLGTISVTSTEKASGTGSFVGYASDGLPLFNFLNQSAEELSNQIGKQIFRGVQSTLRQIRDDRTTRKIFYLFLINLGYAIVEFIYGHLTNSTSLISDGFHMLFDSFALFIGICAPVMSRSKPTNTFPFGFDRVEVLFGFFNASFFLFVTLIVSIEAFQRLWAPPLVDASRVLPVAVVGLVINLFGIYSFRTSNLDHRRFYPHTNSGSGMFMLVIADTLGSIGVIVSSIIMNNWGMFILDPLCSLLILTLMAKNLFPLMKESARILLLTIPVGMERNVQQALLQLLSLEGVKGYKNHRFWAHAPDVFTGSISIQVTQETNEQQLIRQTSALFSAIGFNHFTIQVEKDEFIARRSLNVGGMDENCNKGHKDKDISSLRSSNSAQVDRICQNDNSHASTHFAN